MRNKIFAALILTAILSSIGLLFSSPPNAMGPSCTLQTNSDQPQLHSSRMPAQACEHENGTALISDPNLRSLVRLAAASSPASEPPTVPPLAAPDRRERVNLSKEDESFLQAVGMVYEKEKWVGSGFLISKCHVLTANHVAFDHANEQQDPMILGKEVKFGVGQLVSGTQKKEIVSGKVVGFDKKIKYQDKSDPKKNLYNTGRDWALVKISKSNDGTYLGEKYKPLCMLNKENGIDYYEAKNYTVRTVGYPQNKLREFGKAELWQDSNCKIIDSDTESWFTNCQIRPGMSGGPVATFKDNCWTVLALNSSRSLITGGFAEAGETDLSLANYVTPLDTINWNRIVNAMKNNPCD